MQNKIIIKTVFLIFILSCSVTFCEAQRSPKNPERTMFGKSHSRRQTRIRELPAVRRAKKKQEANERKLNKEYAKYVEETRKRSLSIQTPEVKERMIENRKESDKKYKEKRKKREENFRKSGMKLK
jgi:hypothetical protein